MGIIFSRSQGVSKDRVVVFLDYQNIYYLARNAFFSDQNLSNFYGQISPIKLGELLIQKGSQERSEKGLPNRELTEVRVYTGIPNPDFNKDGYSRSRRQFAIWPSEDPRVTVKTRELRYPTGWPRNHREGEKPREKGVDIALAIDFVTMAYKHEYEVGIIFSADSDFKPALEYVWDKSILARPEVAAWKGNEVKDLWSEKRYNQRLSLDSDNRNPYCHWLDREDYEQICDHTDYR